MIRTPAELLLARPGFVDDLVASLSRSLQLDEKQTARLLGRLTTRMLENASELTPSGSPRAPSIETLVAVVAARMAWELAGKPETLRDARLDPDPPGLRLLRRLVEDGIPLERAAALLAMDDPQAALGRVRRAGKRGGERPEPEERTPDPRPSNSATNDD
jgi:hypothetical protein